MNESDSPGPCVGINAANHVWSCSVIQAGTLVCCVVWFIVHPHFVPKKSTVLPTVPRLNKGGHVCAARTSSRFINITRCTMEPLAARPSRWKDGRLSCQPLIQGAAMCGEYGRCCPFSGAARCERALQEGSSGYIGVCVCGGKRSGPQCFPACGRWEQRRMGW